MPKLDLQPLSELESEIKTKTRAKLKWQSQACTHIGRVRPINEDAFFESDEQGLWAVADGMGGHGRGDFASKALINALSKFIRKDDLTQNISDLETRLIGVNEKCRTAFRNKQPGTTAALIFEFASYCFFIWAGDSRIFRLRDGKLKLMTADHSVAQDKYLRGLLTFDEAIDHDSTHILTKAIGAHAKLSLEMRFEQALANDRYLICSDGLYNDFYIQEMETILSQNETNTALEQLIEGALARGGSDNITAVIVACYNDTPI